MLGQEASGTIVALPTAKDLLEDEEYKLRGFSVGDRVVAVRATPSRLERRLTSRIHLVDSRLFCGIPLSALAQGRQAAVASEHKRRDGSGRAGSYRWVMVRHTLKTPPECYIFHLLA